MNTAASQKTTPAMKRATARLKQSLTHLQSYDLCDLQQRVQADSLAPDHKCALAAVLDNLYQLAQAEALRDSGGKQQDMFAHLDNANFAAWVRPMNQRTLF